MSAPSTSLPAGAAGIPASAARAAAEPILRAGNSLLEKTGDRLNPILVKESRQALKSKQFLFTFLLLLIAAWAVSVFGLALSDASLEYGTVGRDFFFAFYVVLAVAATLAIPFGAHRSLLSERDLNTYDLLSITTLSPGKIVRGKLASAILQLFIFYSAITPFMAFASLLNGFDTPTAAYVLVGTFLWSLLLCTAALMFATLAKNRLAQGFLSLVVLCGLGFALMGELLVVSEIADGHFPLDRSELWYFSGFVVLIGATYFLLFQQITTAQITFEADNRTTGIRLVATGQFWLIAAAVVGMGVFLAPSPMRNNEFQALLVPAFIHFAVFGLFSATEPDVLSRRVRRELPRFRLLRLALIPFLPGGARGYLWILLSLIGLWWGVVVAHALIAESAGSGYPTSSTSPFGPYTGSGSMGSRASSPLSVATALSFEERVISQVSTVFSDAPERWPTHLKVTTVLCLYVVAYLGLGCVGGRWLRRLSGEINSSHIRVLTFLALMAGMMLPFLPRAVRWNYDPNFAWFDVTNPIAVVNHLWSGDAAYSNVVMLLVGGAAVLMVALNTRAMLAAARTVIHDDEATH